MTAC